MQCLKKEPFCLQFVEEVSVDHEDGVVQDVAEGWTDDQKFPAVTVRPGTGKQWVNASRDCLEQQTTK